ncbi:MAG: YdiU family protein [Kofleriaceae bacterium]
MPIFAADRLDDRFLRALPIDASAAPGVRQVTGAVASLVTPTPVREPRLLAYVPEVAAELGLPATPPDDLAAVLAGNTVEPGMRPYAACYGGHQFGHWAGQLGDGRAITLAEVLGPDGARREVQLKGAGRTPYSRGADGRAVLRSSLRELVCSEAMHHLGIPTTRALALVATGDVVVRDMFYDGNPEPEPGAITTRVAPSFLRFGNFELPAIRGDHALLRRLVDDTLATLYPELEPTRPGAEARMFVEVCRRTARTVAGWMRVGFVHGVMNTDNMSILGLTIDYGPYGWLEPFDLTWTPNTTDAAGRRYCFGAQPHVAQWNLLQLARALLPLGVAEDELAAGIGAYQVEFTRAHLGNTLAKLGLREAAADADGDDPLLAALPGVLTAAELDFTLFFRRLAEVDLAAGTSLDARMATLADACYGEVVGAPRARLEVWLDEWAARSRHEGDAAEARRARMDAVNPLYVPRNYLAQEVIDAAATGDLAPLHALLEVGRRPYQPQPGAEALAARRPEWARDRAGCSMLSCSS